MMKQLFAFLLLVPAVAFSAARPAPLPESRLTGTLHGEGQTITNIANVVTSNGVSLVGLSASKADASALSATSNTLAQAVALKADASALAATSNALSQATALKADTSALTTTSNTLAQAVALKADATALATTSNTFALALGNLSIGDPNAVSRRFTTTSTAPLTLVVSNGLINRMFYVLDPNGYECKKFDGVGDRCELLIPKTIVTYPITIGGWFIVNANALVGSSIADPSAFDRSIGIGVDQNRQPYGNIYNSTTSVTSYYAPSVAIGDLVHVQFVLISDTERHLYVNGNEVAISQESKEFPAWSSANLRYWVGGLGRSSPLYRTGICSSQYVKFAAGDGTISYEDCYCAYNLAAGPALIEWDVSGNGRHGTYTTTSGINTMATTSDLVRPHNILDGFTLYTHATLDPIRVPYDVNGDPLAITPPTGYTLDSEHPGGTLHYGAESLIEQTDDSSIFVFPDSARTTLAGDYDASGTNFFDVFEVTPQLQIPQGTVTLYNASETVTLYNVGTTGLTWTATDNAMWLDVTSYGSIAAESSGTMTLSRIDSTTNGATASVSVVAAGTTNVFTVIYGTELGVE